MLQGKHITFSYPEPAKGKTDVLADVSFEIREHDFIGLIGASGSGKTTLIKHLNGLLKAESGEILFKGENIYSKKYPVSELRKKVGLVFQYPEQQLFGRTILKDVMYGPLNLGMSEEEAGKSAKESLELVGISEEYYQMSPMELSGGQKRCVAIAGVLAMQPEILILDEPTSQLDPIAASDFLNTLRKINAELGTTILITEHRVEDIFPYADRAIVMDGGKVIANDTPRNIGKRLWEEKNDMFTAMPTPVRVFYGSGGAGECPLTVREGRNWLSDIFPNPPEITELPAQPQTEEDGEIALSLKELWFRYEKNSPDVLRGASVEVAKGSLHAIVGGNGAGKSTTLKAVCGICRPYRGKVKVLGKPVEKYKQQELFRGCLAMLPQDPKSLFVKKTVLEDLQEMTQNEQDIRETAEICQITSLLKSHPYDLSGGEQQRAALAKVLLTRPQLLLLDEPTKGIDSFFKEIFASILTELKKKGITVVMVSHDVEFCARYADQVSMFFDGQVLTTDTPRRFFGANSFYTTAANRMSRHVFRNAVTAEDVVDLYKQNRETKA